MRLSSIINGCYVTDVSKITVFSERIEIASSNTLIETYSLDHMYSVGLLETRGFDGGNAAGENTESKNTNDSNIIREVSKWLNRMQLADKLEVKHEGRSVRYRIDLKVNGKDINLKDVGIGVSQVLPVLVIAYFAPENSTIILEEPEIHLHPLAQVELAELFVEVSKTRKIQFLVETHSEHLFRRLQTIISRDDMEKDQCALYFIENKGTEANLRKLEADEYGRIHNRPNNFFGKAMEETREQRKMRLKKERTTQYLIKKTVSFFVHQNETRCLKKLISPILRDFFVVHATSTMLKSYKKKQPAFTD